MPRKNKNKNHTDAKNSQNAGKVHFINSNTSAGTAYRVRVADDIVRSPLAPDLSRIRMPKNMQTQIHWLQTTQIYSQALANNAITEANLQFQLNATAIASGVTTLFDQYAIFAVYVRATVNSTSPVSTNTQQFITAIDYDNITNLGSTSTLAGYSTALTTSLAETHERYIEPCNAPALYSGSTFSHYGQARMWVDCSNPGTPHYGLRCIVFALGSGVTGNVTFDISYVICARNVI